MFYTSPFVVDESFSYVDHQFGVNCKRDGNCGLILVWQNLLKMTSSNVGLQVF